MKKVRVLILMAKTGGGHTATATAISQALDNLYKNKVHVEVKDGLREFAPFPLSHLDITYPWQLKISTNAYSASWRALNRTLIAKQFIKQFWPLVKNSAYKIIRKRYDVIVSTHPAFVYPCLIAKKNLNRNIRFISMVPDLAVAHALWCAPEADLVLVPTKECAEDAMKHGVPEYKIRITGLPIRSEFIKTQKHKINKLKTILLMAGGNGLGRVFEIAKAIGRSKIKNAEMLVVTGKNSGLLKKLERTDWKIPVKIFGFTDKIPELMNMSSILVTKGGPTTIAEAFAVGLPMIIFDFIPSQEEKNVDLVVKNKAGKFIKNPRNIVKTLKLWLKDKRLLRKMSKSAIRSSRPRAAFEASRLIYKLAKN